MYELIAQMSKKKIDNLQSTLLEIAKIANFGLVPEEILGLLSSFIQL